MDKNFFVTITNNTTSEVTVQPGNLTVASEASGYEIQHQFFKPLRIQVNGNNGDRNITLISAYNYNLDYKGEEDVGEWRLVFKKTGVKTKTSAKGDNNSDGNGDKGTVNVTIGGDDD
jgi:hypothetical protein